MTCCIVSTLFIPLPFALCSTPRTVAQYWTRDGRAVIGPAGVFSINTKNLAGKVRVTERTFRHNDIRTDYLPKATREGQRATALLGVDVRPVLAVICDEFIVKVNPIDVDVVARRNLRRWLEGLPPRLSASETFAIARRADDPATGTAPLPAWG